MKSDFSKMRYKKFTPVDKCQVHEKIRLFAIFPTEVITSFINIGQNFRPSLRRPISRDFHLNNLFRFQLLVRKIVVYYNGLQMPGVESVTLENDNWGKDSAPEFASSKLSARFCFCSWPARKSIWSPDEVRNYELHRALSRPRSRERRCWRKRFRRRRRFCREVASATSPSFFRRWNALSSERSRLKKSWKNVQFHKLRKGLIRETI